MPFRKMLQEVQCFEIQAYKRPKDKKVLTDTHVAFSGSPYKHPYDHEKVILLNDPFSTSTFYYELKTEDISFIEELPNIVNSSGKIFTIIRVWVKKGSIALRCTPFVVESTMR